MLSYWIQSVLEPLWTRAPQWVGIPSPGDELTSNQHIRNSTIGKERSTSLKLPLFFPQLLLRFFLSTNSSCSCMHSTSLLFSLPSFMPFFSVLLNQAHCICGEMLCPSQAVHLPGQPDYPSCSHLAGIPPASQWLLQKCGTTFPHIHEGRSQCTLKDNTKQFLPSVLVIVEILLSVFYCILEMEQARDR